MAVWQFMGTTDKPVVAPCYDDGDPYIPGDPAFSTSKVTAQMASVSGATSFNYVGQSEASSP